MSTYAIGDIHGCLASLIRLSELVNFQSQDQIIFLGDYIDRGPDAKGVIDWIMERRQSIPMITLRGNHEVMILEAKSNHLKSRFWSSYGGFETLMSYGSEYADDWVSTIPDAHWKFFQETRNYYETESHIFVHGKVEAKAEMSQQNPHTLLWDKCHDMKPHLSGKKIICGHTPQMNGAPGVYEFGVCIDTGVYMGGWLTCLNPSTGDYWQANELGETRQGNINP